jgi:hypothetical protein
MMTEDDFSKLAVDFFQEHLAAGGLGSTVEVLAKQQILRDITVGRDPKSRRWTIYAGFQQQDIVFAPRNNQDSLPIWRELPQIAYHWLKGGQQHLVIPLLVCELKMPQSMNTHQFITYGRIAEQIKAVHPFCQYYFLLYSNADRHLMPETVLRQGKGFDRIFLNWENEKEGIWETIKNHLTYLREKLGLI